MSDLIPQVIMADILLRLRVKDLVSCRRVSKQWLSIIDDPHFICNQRSLSKNSNSVLFLRGKKSERVLYYWKQKQAASDDISRFSFFTPPSRYEPNENLC
ncbi:hypothetical protein LINGRAHAP2_LOCUS29201 [Linum grandiflorum]